jgi:hypothetical protein
VIPEAPQIIRVLSYIIRVLSYIISELFSTPDSSKMMSDFILYDHTVEIGVTYYEFRYALSG